MDIGKKHGDVTPGVCVLAPLGPLGVTMRLSPRFGQLVEEVAVVDSKRGICPRLANPLRAIPPRPPPKSLLLQGDPKQPIS